MDFAVMNNSITIAGRIGNVKGVKDVGDSHVLSFSVASDIGYGDGKKTLWVSCAVWGKRAISLRDFLSKGKAVTVFGQITENRAYSSDNGPGADLSIRVIEITLQGNRSDDRSQEPMGPPKFDDNGPELDDEIPF